MFFIAQFCHSHLQSNITLPKKKQTKNQKASVPVLSYSCQTRNAERGSRCIPHTGRTSRGWPEPRVGLQGIKELSLVPSAPPSPWKWKSHCSQSAGVWGGSWGSSRAGSIKPYVGTHFDLGLVSILVAMQQQSDNSMIKAQGV